MKAELVANLITAHASGDETKFKSAVEALASDEEKKGNNRTANVVRDAYKGKKSSMVSKPEPSFANTSSTGFAAQSASSSAAFTPRDKDSYLELYEIVHPETSISDVILPDSQMKILHQILEERAKNDKLAEHNLPLANRLLLCGPPGCGKTMTAYAIAHEMNLPMAYVRLDGLVSSYLGQTSVNLRKVFSSLAGNNVVLFLDEFDAIAKKRDDSNEMGELKRVVTALLQNFDSMPENIFLIAATNHEHLLDPAIWRRFNFVMYLGYPEEPQRAALIEKWLNQFRIIHEVDIQKLAHITADRSAGQLKELIVLAAKRSVTIEKPLTTDDCIELFIQQLTNYSGGVKKVEAANLLYQKGVSIRTLAKILGIPHNTLAYQIKKLTGEEGADDGE